MVLILGHVGRTAALLVDCLGNVGGFPIDQTQLTPQLRIAHYDEYPVLGVARRRGTDGRVDYFRDNLVRHWIRLQPAQSPRRIHRLEQSDIAHSRPPIEYVNNKGLENSSLQSHTNATPMGVERNDLSRACSYETLLFHSTLFEDLSVSRCLRKDGRSKDQGSVHYSMSRRSPLISCCGC